MTAVVINGAAGRMGRNLVAAVAEREDLKLSGAVEQPGSEVIDRDAGELARIGSLDVPIRGDITTALAGADILIDFSTPEATAEAAQACADLGVRMVIGTTGLDTAQRRAVEDAAEKVGVVFAANYSAGITLALRLIDTAARVLGDGYDAEVLEAHHRYKADAPSGTALRMGEVLAEALGRDLERDAVYSRQGRTGARDARTIGFASMRGGDIVGEHTALFAGLGERLEVTHRASSRMTFARGAARAAAWLPDKGPGLYDMEDVLGLR